MYIFTTTIPYIYVESNATLLRKFTTTQLFLTHNIIHQLVTLTTSNQHFILNKNIMHLSNRTDGLSIIHEDDSRCTCLSTHCGQDLQIYASMAKYGYAY